jgi:hypothetical protein
MLNQGDYIRNVQVVIFWKQNRALVSGEELQGIAGEGRISECDQVGVGIVSEESDSDVIAHVSEFHGAAEDGFKPRVDISST